MSPLPRIAVIPGEPAGIGPEIVAKLLAQPDVAQAASILLVGDRHVFDLGRRQAGVAWALRDVDPGDPGVWWQGEGPAYLGHAYLGHAFLGMETIGPEDVRLAEASEAGGRSSLRTLDAAVDLATAGTVDGVLFGPFNKASLHLAGMDAEDEHRYVARHIGFTGHHGEVNMLDELMTTRVTSHIALKDVVEHVTIDAVVKAIRLARDTLSATGVPRPRIGVAAINPHAGDGGNFGTEEIDVLAPAIEKARALQIDVDGPWPSDTVFLRGRDGLLDAVVTMYHDQGQIAMKLMGFDRGVTIAAGLPIPMATPAHGTAFDIAGHGKASPRAMRKAFDMICRMASGRREGR